MMSHCPTVPLALQPLLKETIPVKLYRDPIGHPRLQYACSGTNGFNVISRVFLEGILYSCLAEDRKEFDENALSRENPDGAVGCLFVWGQDKCECVDVKNLHGEGILTIAMVPFQKLHAYKGIIFMKHLSKVWHEYQMWNKSDTLLLDDSPERYHCIINLPIHILNHSRRRTRS